MIPPVVPWLRNLTLSALSALFVVFAFSTAAFAAGMTISIGPSGTILKPGNTTVSIPVSVTCTVYSNSGYAYTPASGTVTVNLSQTFKGITRTGSGSAQITCTGQPQSLVVNVVASSGGDFRPGAATVSAAGSATGTFDYRIGYCDASTGQCYYQIITQSYTDTGSAGPQPITLVTPD